MLNEQQFYLFVQIQTSQTGGQLYSDTSPNGECSLASVLSRLVNCLPVVPFVSSQDSQMSVGKLSSFKPSVSS